MEGQEKVKEKIKKITKRHQSNLFIRHFSFLAKSFPKFMIQSQLYKSMYGIQKDTKAVDDDV